jgi:hypothetical protein
MTIATASIKTTGSVLFPFDMFVCLLSSRVNAHRTDATAEKTRTGRNGKVPCHRPGLKLLCTDVWVAWVSLDCCFLPVSEDRILRPELRLRTVAL